MATERPARRVIPTNPDEPKAGDYSYGLYDKAHPVFGDPDTVAYFKRELRGLRGEHVTVTFKGVRIDDDGETRRFNVRRTIKYNQYSDMFGPGSAFASATHAIRERHSDETLVTQQIIIEHASDEDDYDE